MSKFELGVISGKEIGLVFSDIKKIIMLPTVNVSNTSTVNACIRNCCKSQLSCYCTILKWRVSIFWEKGLSNVDHQAQLQVEYLELICHSMAELYGVTTILHTDHCAKKLLPWVDGLLEAGEEFYEIHGKPLYSSHMIDLSEEPLEENIELCKEYLKRMSKIGMTLEIELGITGGEEDGVDNTDIDSINYILSQRKLAIYEELMKISDQFTITGFWKCSWCLQTRKRSINTNNS